MADGGMVALDVRRRKAVAGCRATWPDHPGYAGALRTVPPTLAMARSVCCSPYDAELSSSRARP